MSDLSFTPRWNNGINQLENGEPISGGVAGNANIATRQLAENVFFLRNESSEAVNTEKNRAIGRENSIESTLDTKISDEISRATNKENSITDSINAEISRATDKENSINSTIVTEIGRAIKKENEILQYATEVNSNLTSKINTEISERSADTVTLLASNASTNKRIEAETNRAVAAENSITSRLNSWVSFSYIGPTPPNTTGWKANDIWLDTSTEI